MRVIVFNRKGIGMVEFKDVSNISFSNDEYTITVGSNNYVYSSVTHEIFVVD